MKDRKKNLTEDNIQLRNKHKKKRCSTSLLIRDIYIKTTMRQHYKPTSMATIKIVTIPNADEGVKKSDLLYIPGENVRCQVHS